MDGKTQKDRDTLHVSSCDLQNQTIHLSFSGAVEKAAKEQRDWIEDRMVSQFADLKDKIDKLEAREHEIRDGISAQNAVIEGHVNDMEERMRRWVIEQNETIKNEIARLEEKFQTESRHFAEQLATASTSRIESQHRELVEKLDLILSSHERQPE